MLSMLHAVVGYEDQLYALFLMLKTFLIRTFLARPFLVVPFQSCYIAVFFSLYLDHDLGEERLRRRLDFRQQRQGSRRELAASGHASRPQWGRPPRRLGTLR